MPISTAGINSILEAYQQGIMTSQYKRSEATRQKERAENIKLEEQHRKEDIARLEQHYNLEQAKQDALHTAAANLQQYELQNKMQEIYRKTGETPSGYSSIKAESVPISEGVAGTKQTFGPDTSSLNPILQKPVFSAMDPTSARLQEAGLENISLEPKTQAAIRIKQAEDAANAAKEQKKQEFEAEQNKLKRENDREIAKIRSQATNDPQKKLALWNETPVSDNEAELYNVPAGTLHKDIAGKSPGVKLSTEQQNKIAYIDGMIEDAKDAKILLDPENGGIGYEKYFQGTPGVKGILSGSMSEAIASRKGETDKNLAAIRNKLASGFDKQKVESAGKVLNAAELKILNAYSIPYEHTMNPAQAKANLEQFITNALRTKEAIQGGAANRVVNKNAPNRVKVDAQGNEIVK